jgi:hypothetical protein
MILLSPWSNKTLVSGKEFFTEFDKKLQLSPPDIPCDWSSNNGGIIWPWKKNLPKFLGHVVAL